MKTFFSTVAFLLTSLIVVASDSVNIGTKNATIFGFLSLSADYSNISVDVNWLIEVPAGLNVYLQFITLEMISGDYVSVYDGSVIDDDNLLKSSNGFTNCQFTAISSDQVATVRYVGVPSSSQFLASYSVPVTSSSMLKCTNDWQSLTSPGYPGPYPSYLDIIWTLFAPKNSIVQISFQALHIQNVDYLTIYDGENTFIPPTFSYSVSSKSTVSSIVSTSTSVCTFYDNCLACTSSSNFLTLRFTSVESIGETGFEIIYGIFQSGTTCPSLQPKLTSTLPPTVSTSSTMDVCSSHGNYTCNCYYGYTGQHCENEINFCDELITDYTGTPIIAGELCLHGHCYSSPLGASCQCARGFTGQFCQDEIANQTVIATRCALYTTNSTSQLGVPIGCAQHEICIPDNLNCAVYEACQKPLGWCIPFSGSTVNYLTQIRNFMQTQEKFFH